MLFDSYIVKNTKTGQTQVCANSAEAARLLRSNPYLEADPATRINLEREGIDAGGNRMDGCGLLGNLTGNPGGLPGSTVGGGLFNLLGTNKDK